MNEQENTETLVLTKASDGWVIVVQHDQTGSAYDCQLSESAYLQLKQHFEKVIYNELPTNDAVKIESSDVLNAIRTEAKYCESKEMEYSQDYNRNTGNRAEYWRGKADTHRFIAIKLRRQLEWFDQK